MSNSKLSVILLVILTTKVEPKSHPIPPVIKSIHLHLHDLALDPTAQEKGLLRLLLNYLFTVLTTTSYQSISLISVQNSAYITVMRLRPFFFE